MGNVWRQFEELLPKKKQFIGEVTSVNAADKTCTVNMVGGGTFVVKGDDVTVGRFYLIEAGEIKREVPGLTIYTAIIY